MCRFHARVAIASLLLLAFVAITFLSGSVGFAADAKTKRPNILVIFIDDWGRHASAYAKLDGSGTINDLVQTPNFDKVASEGLLFRQAFVSAPSCTPCRSALLSGQHFWRTGRGSILRGARWDGSNPSFPLLLRDSGYHIGKMYKVWSPGTPVDAPFGEQKHAYQKAGGRMNSFSQNVTSQVAEGLPLEKAKQNIYDEVGKNFDSFLAARKGDQPFCFWFGPTNTHRKWVKGSGQKLWGLDPDKLKGKVPPFLPDVPEVREDLADYLGEAMAVDGAIGTLVDRLKQAGELDNTIIVISGDHGAPGFPHGKCNLYDFGTRVPLAIRWGDRSAGQVSEDLISLTDIAPTLLEAAGVKIPKSMTGRSLLPLLEANKSGQIDPERKVVFVGRERHVDSAREGHLPYPQRAIRTPEHLLIINFKPDRWPLGMPFGLDGDNPPSLEDLTIDTRATIKDEDAGPTKAWIVSHRQDPQWSQYYQRAYGKRPRLELYDVVADPQQMRNLAEDSKYRPVRDKLEARLMHELRQTGDPRVVDDGKFFENPPLSGPAAEDNPRGPVPPPAKPEPKRSSSSRSITNADSTVALAKPADIPADPAEGAKRPNIVLIMADDMGYSDLGCYGGEIDTPNLDKLAAGGLRFTQFYNTARCCPTRASLLTGLYPHQAGMGQMHGDLGVPSYQGYLNNNCVTLAEVLGPAGYTTMISGKWHLGNDRQYWPLKRGFDQYWGSPYGGGAYFKDTVKLKFRSHIQYVQGDQVIDPPDDMYVTDEFTDQAIAFLDKAAPKPEPFFLYVAHFAPHFPLQAKPTDIAKYKGRYDQGWDATRQRRFARQRQLGVVTADNQLSQRDNKAKPWEKMSPAQQRELAHHMEIYAAQVDCLDQNVGRIVAKLTELNQLDNTVIIFLSDNGCSAEGGPGGFNRGRPGAEIGTAMSYYSLGLEWANVCDTPFRKFKLDTYEGGISTPLIVHWPKGIAGKGELRQQPGHVIDLMPTLVELSGASYPTKLHDKQILPLEGKSLVPAFENQSIARDTIYWEHEGNKAIRQGDVKGVAKHRGEWELYDLQSDRAEEHNLAQEKPEKIAELAALWNAWAERCDVREWGDLRKKALSKTYNSR